MEFKQIRSQHRHVPVLFPPALKRWWYASIATPLAPSPSQALRATLLQMALVVMIGLGCVLLVIGVVFHSRLVIIDVSIALPIAMVSWWLNRHGHSAGIWLFLGLTGMGVLVAYPASVLVTTDVNPPLLFVLPVLLAAVFLRPSHATWMAILFYSVVAVRLALADIAPTVIAAFIAFAVIDTFLVLAPTLLLLEQLNHVLQREIRANVALKTLNVSLDAQVAARTRETAEVNLSLERVNIALQQANAAQTQWLDARREQTANAAHDQKGELASLLIAVQDIDVVLEGYDIPPALRADYDARVMASIDAIDRLVTALVTAAQLESHALALHVAPIDVCCTLDAVAKRMQAVCQRDGITLHRVATPLPTLAVADAEHLERMIANLIDNARKHHYQPEIRRQRSITPAITLQVGPHAPGMVGIAVADNGPGIVDVARARQRWAQGHPEAPGTGLGLSLCGALAHQMGGRLDLQSTVDVGTTATIILPTHYEQPQS